MYPTILAGGLTLMLAAADDVRAENARVAQPQPSPVAVTRPSVPVEQFQTPEMAEQFAAYLEWAKAQGLSRLVALERLDGDRLHLSPHLSAEPGLPTPEMVEQFDAYLRWTREQGLGRFHAFKVTDFD
jgi:hypothetical protein